MSSKRSVLRLGLARPLSVHAPEPLELPAQHLVTHGVVVGMTGSGKTGLVTVLVEEALRAGIPVLVFDVKGDLPNLALAPASFAPEAVAPWLPDGEGDVAGSADESESDSVSAGESDSGSGSVPAVESNTASDSASDSGSASVAESDSDSASDSEPESDSASRWSRAVRLASEREAGLRAWGIGEDELAAYAAQTHVRIVTPGSDAGELLHVLSGLERRSSRWDTDEEGARAALSATLSLLLRLVGRDADPARSKDHVLLAVLAERRLRAGESAALEVLIHDLVEPPIEEVGALPLESFVSARARKELAASLNALLASPSFASWRRGATLDVGAWLERVDGKTPATIVSVAHLDDDERELVLGLVLEEVLTWVRSLRGADALRALVVFDEVYGFLPPHPAQPATKRPLVALMKQARAFGVGVVLATQNPMDLDYRALSNAGVWALGRLQTDADRERVVEGLCGDRGGEDASSLRALLKRLGSRWFVLRDVHDGGATRLFQPRWAMSLLRGPMTREELRRAKG